MEHEDAVNPYAIPDDVAHEVTLERLRPFAIRAVWRILVDDEANDRTRLEAAKLVIEKTKPEEAPDAQAQGSDAVVDLETERLWRELQKHH